MNPGVKDSDLFMLKNILETTLLTAEKRQLSKERSSRKKWRSSSGIVKTQCLWTQLISLKDIEVVRSMEYIFPQVVQNLL